MKTIALLSGMLAFVAASAQEHDGFRLTYSSRIAVSYGILNNNLAAPTPKKIVYPEYPWEMVRAGLQAIVVLRCPLNADGSVGEIRMISVSNNAPSDQFTEPSIAAVRQWKFLPLGTAPNSYPGPVTIEVKLKFELPD